MRFFAACATRADRTTSLRAAMAAALRLVVLRLPPWRLTVLPLAAPAFLAVAALLPCVPPAPGAAGSARPSLMAPSTSRFSRVRHQATSTMMLWSPATDGMKVRKKIASFALFIRANTSARSGGVGGRFVFGRRLGVGRVPQDGFIFDDDHVVGLGAQPGECPIGAAGKHRLGLVSGAIDQHHEFVVPDMSGVVEHAVVEFGHFVQQPGARLCVGRVPRDLAVRSLRRLCAAGGRENEMDAVGVGLKQIEQAWIVEFVERAIEIAILRLGASH